MSRVAFTSWVAGLTVLALGPAVALAQQPAVPRPLDPTKTERIELPTARLVGRGTAPAAAESANPKVEPGKVGWHPSFAAACDASRKSGKPVLLFQMMGKLDDRFC